MEFLCPTLPSVVRFQEANTRSAETLLRLRAALEENNDVGMARACLAANPLFQLDRTSVCNIVGAHTLRLMQRRRTPDDVAQLEALIDLCPSSLSFEDGDGMNALHYYCMQRLPFIEDDRLLDCLLDHDGGGLAW